MDFSLFPIILFSCFMRHNVFGNQLGRNTKQARALYRGLTRELLVRGRIKTTLAKAKAIVPMVDRIITFAKKNTISARREVVKILGSESPLEKIFKEIAPRFTDRNSGYSRIIRLNDRFQDTTKLAIIELVEGVAVESVKTEPKEKPVIKRTKKTKKAALKKKL